MDGRSLPSGRYGAGASRVEEANLYGQPTGPPRERIDYGRTGAILGLCEDVPLLCHASFQKPESCDGPERCYHRVVNSPTNSLERGLMMLELVARRSGGLSNAEIGRYFNVATSTCSYILGRMESHGYLKRDRDTGRYEIGIKIAGLAIACNKTMLSGPFCYRLCTAWWRIPGLLQRWACSATGGCYWLATSTVPNT